MGKLIIVPTPIGNLEDITLRALRVLGESGLILAEDTRTTGILLKRHGITKLLMPYHKFNEHKALEKLIAIIRDNDITALVSDAGTPAISDPGFLLVRECIANGLEVECLPGATAFIPALVNSGLPADRFVFEGFLPVKKGRQTKFRELTACAITMVFYESPHRLLRTLEQLSEVLGAERKASVSRELTKIYEETVRGTLAELIHHFSTKPVKGEIVLVVAGKSN